jgi:hypothetical protein
LEKSGEGRRREEKRQDFHSPRLTGGSFCFIIAQPDYPAEIVLVVSNVEGVKVGLDF